VTKTALSVAQLTVRHTTLCHSSTTNSTHISNYTHFHSSWLL